MDAVAYDIYRAGGGWAEPAEESWRDAVVRDIHGDQPEVLGGLSSLGLQDEFDYVITGRGIHSIEAYLNMPRTGRGSPLGEQARREVWRRYQLYRTRLDDEAKYGWHEIRAEALQMLSAGEVRRRYASVIADETQDLTETSVRLLVALAGAGPRPAVTFVGDGQQSIYPGGFSLRSLGVEVRGRSFVLRTNWRNTYAIWLSASAFIADEQFDDLEEELDERPPADQPYPLRDGIPPRLHQLDTFDEASEWLAELVADDLEAGADPGDCAVLTPTNALAARLEGALTRAGVTARGLDRYAGEHSDSVWVGTFHRAKGLEFKHVYVLGLEAANWPPRVPGLEPGAQSEADGRAVRAAFVGMTRARDSLDVVTTQEPAPRLAEAAWRLTGDRERPFKKPDLIQSVCLQASTACSPRQASSRKVAFAGNPDSSILPRGLRVSRSPSGSIRSANRGASGGVEQCRSNLDLHENADRQTALRVGDRPRGEDG